MSPSAASQVDRRSPHDPPTIPPRSLPHSVLRAHVLTGYSGQLKSESSVRRVSTSVACSPERTARRNGSQASRYMGSALKCFSSLAAIVPASGLNLSCWPRGNCNATFSAPAPHAANTARDVWRACLEYSGNNRPQRHNKCDLIQKNATHHAEMDEHLHQP